MKTKFDIRKITKSRESSLVIVLLVMCVLIQLRNSIFLSVSNLNDMFVNATILSILSLGMMCVLLIAGIDISIGSTLALSGMAAGLVMRDNPATPTILLFLIAILVGTACGFLNGIVIAKGKVIPIIATMGFMNIFRGATYLIAKNQWIAAYQVPDQFKKFTLGRFLGINNMIIVAAICFLIFAYFMKYTRVGRKIYAVGSNSEAAEISGIHIVKIKLLVYTIMGSLCGLCGGLWVSKYASAQGDAAKGIEMDVIAACVIGGVSLNGGKGTVFGVLLGAITLGILNNALPLINVSSFWQDAIKGLIIIAAIILNTVTQRTMAKNNLKGREI
jgi:Ribose/xylose/arabinose/galactoside ABC-type transport systems, permease components